MDIAVDVISDVICPWCYIGKRRLEKAIAQMANRADVSVRWLPFQLNPSMPREGIDRKEYRTRKFGSWQRSLELDAHVAEVGRAEGIEFAFDRMQRTPNTVNAHRLIWLAGEQGRQNEVVEALFRAYFVDARDITNRQTLVDVVIDAGLDRLPAEALLASDEGMEVFQETEALSRQHQIDGVPFFIVHNQLTLAGAQPPEIFLEAFRHMTG